jgi:hypothetical protein
VNRRRRRRSRRIGGWGVNVGLRVVIVAFAVEAALSGADPRFAGKGIVVRDLVFVGAALTLAFPLVHAIRRHPRAEYPLLADTLFLSILAVDMAANSLGLYSLPWRFDLIPHTYGPMAGFATLRVLGVAAVPGAILVNAAHVALEAQEALGDALFGTHNVRGWWDTIGDLSAGVIGSVVVPWVVLRLRAVRTVVRRRQPAAA